MGKTSNSLSDKVRSVATKHRYSADERELGTFNGAASVLPTHNPSQHYSPTNSSPGEANGVSEAPGRSSLTSNHVDHHNHDGGQRGNHTATSGVAADKNAKTTTFAPTYPRAPASNKSQAEGSGDSTIGDVRSQDDNTHHEKLPFGPRIIAGCKRFVVHMKHAMCYSWLNLLLVFVPIGIAADAAHLSPSIIFSINAVAIVPLAGLLAHATETVAGHLGANIGALLNVTFGNAVELIIFIIALTKNEITVIQAAILGSILSNLLLILGMAFLLGGLRYREQIYNSTVTQMSACLLTLSVASLVLPTAFHASFNDENTSQADTKILEVSRGTSVILLLIYILYLVFQLKSHAYMYEATPQHVIDEESHPGVLQHIMLHSSSSSSSDTDTDGESSTNSSTSHSTAGRRLRRLIKNRRRRKSSASTSTAGTVSMPSVNSPTTETRDNYFDGRSQQTSRRTSPLGVIVSGDEADGDADNERPSAPRIRDFVSLDSEALSASHGRKRHFRRHKRKHRKQRQAADVEKAELAEEAEQLHDQVLRQQPPAQTVQLEPAELSEKTLMAEPNRRPFNLRSLSTRGPAIAPSISNLLSNNVFVTPQPQPAPLNRLRTEGALRRTSSLPDRLNKQSTPAATPIQQENALQPTISRRTPAPHVRIAAVVGDDDTIIVNDEHQMSRTAAVVLLICSTALVAVCAEFMVSAIPDMMQSSTVSEAFIGLIILPIVGNAAEHVTAVTVAAKNKMDLAIGVAVGSSIQIALFVTPLIVLLGWIMKVEMSLYFNIFETVSLFVAVLVVNFLCLDGRSNYLEGSLLIAAYVIIALVAFYYPQGDARSAIGGGNVDRLM